MHLATEVSSTTNHQMTVDSNSSVSKSTNNSNNNNNQNNNNTNANNAANSPLTAENLAERAIESLLAEHPGELVRTGSPHVVISISY